jgi:iron complex transport system permease protein
LVLAVLIPLVLAGLILSVGYGDYAIAPADVVRAALGLETGNPDHALVVRLFRLPRILAGLLVGMALALSGAALQGITRNALADPGLLGVNAGAGLAAVWIITTATVSSRWLPWAALVGGLIMAALIYLLAWQEGSAPVRLILVGVGLAALANAATSYLIMTSEILQAQQAMIWLTGSLYSHDWSQVRTLAVWLAVLLPGLWLLARQLNTLGLGDHLAVGLGMRLELQRGLLLLISVALAAVSVSVAGAIAFVGFVAPHMARRLVGPAHEALLPTAALIGGLLVVLSDLVARWIIAPAELPVGVVTAILGAPYFLYLLYRPAK